MTTKPIFPVKKSLTKSKHPILRAMSAVVWSFVGLRSRSDYEKDVEQLNPVHVVIFGLLGTFVFVGSLIGLATWAGSK